MIWRVLLSVLALPGLLGGLFLSIEQLTAGDICPMLGPVPACYIVFAGYALILAAAWTPRSVAWRLFLAGFAPVGGLAAAGTGLEIIQGDVCPQNEGGIPQCYLSLAFAFATFGGFILVRRKATGRL